MKPVQVQFPDKYVEGVDELVRKEFYPSRSAAGRSAVRNMLKKLGLLPKKDEERIAYGIDPRRGIDVEVKNRILAQIKADEVNMEAYKAKKLFKEIGFIEY